MKTKITNSKFKVTKPYSLITFDKNYNYLKGTVQTSNGVVLVYSQGDEKNRHSTHLQFVHNGHVHSRWIDKRFSERYLTTLADRFAKEIVA